MPNIFLIQPDDTLLEMIEQPYDSEDVLQTLLAQHPSVLAGDQMPGDEPLRWLLIDREAGVPGEESGNGRWALDHLFLDQSGIPALVEVKRSTDTRIRREVIGQMLDYAANSVVYWPAGHIRELFQQADPTGWRGRLAAFLELDLVDDTAAIDAFWDTVDTNLRAGKIRLVFVADSIPRELRRIVEFLSNQMSPAEVFAIEIKQYIGGDNIRTLVPKVIGEATTPSPPPSDRWTRETFLAELMTRTEPATCKTAGKILDWVEETFPASKWGSGLTTGSCSTRIIHDGRRVVPFILWSYGSIELEFHWLQYHKPFDSLQARREFARRLSQISGLTISEDSLDKYPSFDIKSLNPEVELAKFFASMEWLKQEVQSAR